MLWLNPSTGDVVEAPKRPSAAWVIVVPATIDGDITQSTLEGLKKAILSSPSYTTRPQDIEIVDKTGLNLYANEQVWERLLWCWFPLH